MSTYFRIEQVDAGGNFVALLNFALDSTAEQIRRAFEVALQPHLNGGTVVAVPVPDGTGLVTPWTPDSGLGDSVTTPQEHEGGFAHLLDDDGQRAHLLGFHHLPAEQIDGQNLTDVHAAAHGRRP